MTDDENFKLCLVEEHVSDLSNANYFGEDSQRWNGCFKFGVWILVMIILTHFDLEENDRKKRISGPTKEFNITL